MTAAFDLDGRAAVESGAGRGAGRSISLVPAHADAALHVAEQVGTQSRQVHVPVSTGVSSPCARPAQPLAPGFVDTGTNATGRRDATLSVSVRGRIVRGRCGQGGRPRRAGGLPHRSRSTGPDRNDGRRRRRLQQHPGPPQPTPDLLTTQRDEA